MRDTINYSCMVILKARFPETLLFVVSQAKFVSEKNINKCKGLKAWQQQAKCSMSEQESEQTRQPDVTYRIITIDLITEECWKD